MLTLVLIARACWWQVHTRTPAVVENIRFVLQLLRAKHPNTCATCDADGDCTFQDLLYRFQVPPTTHPPPHASMALATCLDPSECLVVCFLQVEEVTPPGVRPHFQHQHEWDGCPLVAKAADNQVTPPYTLEQQAFLAIPLIEATAEQAEQGRGGEAGEEEEEALAGGG